MAALIYHIFSSTALLSLGLYHVISVTKIHLKSPRDYSAKPYHPFPSPSAALPPPYHRLKYLQLYLLILCLLVAFAHEILISTYSDPLLKGAAHRFTSLQSAFVVLLFLLLSLSLLLSETTSLLPLPADLFFGVASGIFFLQYTVSSSAASVQTSDLQAKCDSVSARISALASILSLVLACLPRLFVADVGIGASMCLQGLWTLQTGLSLYVDAFIPEGCHELLDVVEGFTKCDLDYSKFRAVAILDLVFVIHVMLVVVIVMVTYAAVVKTVGIKARFGSYEALPTAAAVSAADSNHIQMKALSGTQA